MVRRGAGCGCGCGMWAWGRDGEVSTPKVSRWAVRVGECIRTALLGCHAMPCMGRSTPHFTVALWPCCDTAWGALVLLQPMGTAGLTCL